MILYDVEIKKAILGKNEDPMEEVEYCEGWGDHEGMGVSCVCCYDYDVERFRVFCDDNISEFRGLLDHHDVLVGYNNIRFDNPVLTHALTSDEESVAKLLEYLNSKSYDIFAEIRKVTGRMIGLDAMVKANGLATGKTGNGALAPVWYQTGQFGRLIDYCLADVWLTKKLLDKIILDGLLISPKDGSNLVINSPYPEDNK